MKNRATATEFGMGTRAMPSHPEQLTQIPANEVPTDHGDSRPRDPRACPHFSRV